MQSKSISVCAREGESLSLLHLEFECIMICSIFAILYALDRLKNATIRASQFAFGCFAALLGWLAGWLVGTELHACASRALASELRDTLAAVIDGDPSSTSSVVR